MRYPEPGKPIDEMTEEELRAYRDAIHAYAEHNFRVWRISLLANLGFLALNLLMLNRGINGWGWWWFNIPVPLLALVMQAYQWPQMVRNFLASPHQPGGPTAWIGPVPWPMPPFGLKEVEIEIEIDDE